MKPKKLFALLLCLVYLIPLMGMAMPSRGTGTNFAAQGVNVESGYDYSRFKDAKVTLNIYNWGEYISVGTDGESMDINDEFEALTGIKINYTTFDTNEAMYSKLRSGGANYDVIIPSDYMVGKLAKEGMIAKLDFANIPNYKMIGEPYKNQAYDANNEYSVPYTWGYVGIVYNTTMVDEEVDSWAILWDEAYIDNVLMFDNSRDAFAIASKFLGMSLNPSSPEDIDKAAEMLKKQRSIVQAYVMDQIFDKMGGGEAALAPYYAGDAITMLEENEDLAFAVPKEGTNYFVDAMCIPATSRNKEAAEMYINFLCETEVAAANTLYIGYSTPQEKAAASLPEEIRDNPIAYPSPEVLANMETFAVLPDEINAYMDKAWTDVRGYTEGGSDWVIPIVLFIGIALSLVMSWRRRVNKRNSGF